MDREFELLKKIKVEKEEDFNSLPKRLPQDELDEILKNVIINYTYLYNNEEKTIDEEVNAIVDNMYIILDTLVRMGVHPGFIFDTLATYNYERIKNANKLAYSGKKNQRNDIFFPYSAVRNELKLMNDYNYVGYDENLYLCYDKILTINKELNLPYSTVPKKIDGNRKKGIFISITNQRNNIMNADDIIDESIYLVDLLYTSVNMLVEMGINPEVILTNRINEEKGKHI